MSQTTSGLFGATPGPDNILPLLADAEGLSFIAELISVKRFFDPTMPMKVQVHDFGRDMRRFVLVTPYQNGNLYWDARGSFTSPAQMYGWESLSCAKTFTINVDERVLDDWIAEVVSKLGVSFGVIRIDPNGFSYRRAQQLSAPTFSPVEQTGLAHMAFLAHCKSLRPVGIGEIESEEQALLRMTRVQKGLNSFDSLVRAQRLVR